MVKHSPNERLRLLQQQQQQRLQNLGEMNQDQVVTDADGPPALETPGASTHGLPPVSETLRRAAEVRREAEAQDTGFTGVHPNVNTRRRGADPADDMTTSVTTWELRSLGTAIERHLLLGSLR